MKPCQCPEHPCTGWGDFEGLCARCYRLGHAWGQWPEDDFDDPDAYTIDVPEHVRDYQRDADRYHGRSA